MIGNFCLKRFFPVTNTSPHVEKRHEQLKFVYAVASVMLNNVDRREVLLFVYFLALLIDSLIEREIRNKMAKE